jgi:hypothetical protein
MDAPSPAIALPDCFLPRAYLPGSIAVLNPALQCELNQEFTASFSALPGLKFGTLAAAI